MKIRVPASSANLGPGFDSFGIAWDIYNIIEFSLDTVNNEISGCEEQFCGEDNLALVAYRKTLEYAGAQYKPVKICFRSTDVPVSRGLGSSAALIAAGAVAADRLFELNLRRDELLQIASDIEGHPDNVAPALFGGFSVSILDEGKAVSRKFPVSEALNFAVLIPPFRLSTAVSRAVLPASPSRADAVYNIGRAALLTRAIADGDTDLLSHAMKDRIHQDYRYPLIEGYKTVKKAVEDCAAAAMCISGAGSCLLVVSDKSGLASALKTALADKLPHWQVREVHPDYIGAAVI